MNTILLVYILFRPSEALPFGTGKDSVIIGEDANPDSSRGRRVLGKDAFLAAYVLFGIAGFSLFLTILASLQVTG